MSKIKYILNCYTKFISVPWREDAAPAQRVIFCVYGETEERRMRAKIEEFELATTACGHEWALFDLTDTFAEWMGGHKYAANYFQKPHLMTTLSPQYLAFLEDRFSKFQQTTACNNNTVVVLTGVGTLFGLLKVKEVVDKLAPRVSGRLLVFFPGSYENNNYRLLDGYDGWNYLAVPITAECR